MTQPIDRAFVEIESDTRDFSRDLTHGVEKAYDEVERQTVITSKKITHSFDAAGRQITRTFTTVAKGSKVSTRVIEDAFDDAGDKIRRVFDASAVSAVDAQELIASVGKIAAHSVGSSFEKAGDRIERAFHAARRNATRDLAEIVIEAELAAKLINKKFGNPLTRMISKIADTVVNLGSSLAEFAAEAINPGTLLKIVAILGAIVALTGPIIALGAALAELVGLIGPLPAALGVLLAAILPLVLAFHGLGDAIKAVNSGDPKKIAKAMKGLAPAARAVVKEITGLNGVFTRFRKSIQQSFFTPIVGDLRETINKLLPGIQRGIDHVAGALGRLAENFLALFDQDSTVKHLNSLFSATASIIDAINVPLVNLVDAFLNLTDAGLPFIKQFNEGLGKAIQRFADFINESIKSGAFVTFVKDALRVLGELKDLLVALGGLLGAIFGGASDEGEDFIKTMTEGTKKLTAFFKSAKGQKVLQDLLDNIKAVVEVIGFLIAVMETSAAAVDTFIDAIKFAAKAVATFFKAVGIVLGKIGEVVVNAFGKVVTFFTELPGKIVAALKALPGLVINFLSGLANTILEKIGEMIGLIIFTFTQLPGMIIDAVKALPGILADFFVGLWNRAKEITAKGIDAVVSFVKALPGRVVAFVTSAAAAIGSFFSRIFGAGKDKARSAVDAIIGFIKNLPSRLTAFVKDVGGDIGNAIKNILNHAIDKINEGIKKVDDKLPGDLPRIPHLARGGIVQPRPGGTIANIAEAGQAEVVAPLDRLEQLLRGVGGPTVTFGPGSVVVTFEGAVPTTSQAFQTGQAVGQGIVAALTKRDVRTSVRSM